MPGFQAGQVVWVNTCGSQVGDVPFHGAVTGLMGRVLRQTSGNPPKYPIELLFSFRGINEVEVPGDRITPG